MLRLAGDHGTKGRSCSFLPVRLGWLGCSLSIEMFWIELYLGKQRENAVVKQMMMCLLKYCKSALASSRLALRHWEPWHPAYPHKCPWEISHNCVTHLLKWGCARPPSVASKKTSRTVLQNWAATLHRWEMLDLMCCIQITTKPQRQQDQIPCATYAS